MSWPLLDARDALGLLTQGLPAVDVRSPGEFGAGAIPGFANVAILNDDQRHQVGLAYKKSGSAQAVELGHRLVDPVRDNLVKEWRETLRGAQGLLTCWRGGLRSQIAAEWLERAGIGGWRIEGGYKALRRILLEEIEKPRAWLVLGGLTGSGKTELLRRFTECHVLDLEKLARHRGSAFGGFANEMQPMQQTFENTIGFKLFGGRGLMIVENESGLIGKCSVPPPIRAAIARSSLIRLRASMEDRVQRVYAEYVAEPLKEHPADLVKQSLGGALKRIAKALGGLRASRAAKMMEEAFACGGGMEAHRPWIETLLKEYYDPMYEYGIKRDGRTLLFEGDQDAVKNFVADFVSRWRP